MKTKAWMIPSLLALTACTGSEPDYDASGVFEATEVIVSAKAQGELVSFSVEEGSQVAAAQAVGCIDTVQLSLHKRQLEATERATGSRRLDTGRQVASLRQQIANLRREEARFRQLVADGAAPQKQLDDLGYQITVVQRQLAASTENVQTANSSLSGQEEALAAQIAQIDDQISHSVVRSPIAGTVLAKYAEAGEYAAPGRALFKVADLRRMTLRAYVTAPQLTALKLGQRVRVFADDGEEGRREYAGRLTWISDKAEFTPKTIQTRDERANLVYAVKVSVTNDGYIKQGMYGEVKF